MHRLRHEVATDAGRLLHFLFLWLSALPVDPGRAHQSRKRRRIQSLHIGYTDCISVRLLWAGTSFPFSSMLYWSERRDLNSGPPVPQTGALTGLRYAPKATDYSGRSDPAQPIGRRSAAPWLSRAPRRARAARPSRVRP